MTTMQRNSEHDEQVALFRCIDAYTPQYPDLALAFHVPNGGYRTKATAGRLKAAGVKRGVPDILLPVGRRGYHGMALELKIGTNRSTNDQQWWLGQLKRAGWYTAVCVGWEAAWETLHNYVEGKIA